jgi:hypothetical protein
VDLCSRFDDFLNYFGLFLAFSFSFLSFQILFTDANLIKNWVGGIRSLFVDEEADKAVLAGLGVGLLM